MPGQGHFEGVTEGFAAYASSESAIEHWCLLMERPLYCDGGAQLVDDPAAFVTWIWGRGYASGPNYVATLTSIMRLVARETGDESYLVGLSDELAGFVRHLQSVPYGRARASLTRSLFARYVPESVLE